MIGSFGNLIRTGIYYSMPKLAFRLHHMRHHHDEIEMDLLPALVDPEREAVDVGANIGRYTLPLSRLARHVHAFEPHPRLAYVLSAALDDNVSVHQVLVSDEPGVLALTTPSLMASLPKGYPVLAALMTAWRFLSFRLRR